MNRRLIFVRSLSTFPLKTLSISKDYSVLPHVSMGYPQYKDRLSTCYSPVRHSLNSASTIHTVRLACLKRAASVRSEPGSNSPLYIFNTINGVNFSNKLFAPGISFFLFFLPFPVISVKDPAFSPNFCSDSGVFIASFPAQCQPSE